MKATIDKYGTLHVTAENDLESYALSQWYDNNAERFEEGKALVDGEYQHIDMVFHFEPLTKPNAKDQPL